MLPLVAEHQHDPGIELCQSGGNIAFTRLVEYGADEPQVEGVAGQREYIPGNINYLIIN